MAAKQGSLDGDLSPHSAWLRFLHTLLAIQHSRQSTQAGPSSGTGGKNTHRRRSHAQPRGERSRPNHRRRARNTSLLPVAAATLSPAWWPAWITAGFHLWI